MGSSTALSRIHPQAARRTCPSGTGHTRGGDPSLSESRSCSEQPHCLTRRVDPGAFRGGSRRRSQLLHSRAEGTGCLRKGREEGSLLPRVTDRALQRSVARGTPGCREPSHRPHRVTLSSWEKGRVPVSGGDSVLASGAGSSSSGVPHTWEDCRSGHYGQVSGLCRALWGHTRRMCCVSSFSLYFSRAVEINAQHRKIKR